MHAGQTDRLENSVDISALPTVWDRMIEVGRSVAYYYVDVSYTSFWGSKYKSFSKQYKMSALADDVNSGKLANLTYIDNVGTTNNERGGLSRSAERRVGKEWVSQWKSRGSPDPYKKKHHS